MSTQRLKTIPPDLREKILDETYRASQIKVAAALENFSLKTVYQKIMLSFEKLYIQQLISDNDAEDSV